MAVIVLLSAIPSPPESVLHIGPLAIHAYGFCIALGVLAAVWLSTKRWSALGGTADDITTLATWGVPGGIIGARIYHVATDWELYSGNLSEIVAIWDGGLGIWGGIAGGVTAGLIAAKKRGLPLLTMMDVVAPALALAQAIGRIGNYFNQELFGKPTSLPWALEISPANRPEGYANFATFHPTFLYEGLWNVALCATLIFVGRRFVSQLKPGQLFLMYVAGYTAARFFIEGLRIDFAHTLGGMRVNEWVSLTVFVIAIAMLIASALKTALRTKAKA